MEALLLYLLKANVIISLLFLAYVFLFRNEKSFAANRGFLLSALLLALLLPLAPSVSYFKPVKFPDYFGGIQAQGSAVNTTNATIHTVVAHQQLTNNGVVAGFFAHFTLLQLLMLVYLLVALFLLNRVIFQLFNLFFLYKSSRLYKGGGMVYCKHQKELAPFSFFKVLFFNPAFHYEQPEQIIIHEQVHIRQWHSVDVLLVELTGVLLWINPLMILVKRSIKLNLEYIADEEALKTGIDSKQYQFSILQHSVNLKAYPLTNLFTSSKIKKRIKMINQKKDPASHLYKYLLVLPLALMSYWLVNTAAARPSGNDIAINDSTPMKAFEGIYQNQDAPSAYFKVTISGNKLIAKRLDFKQQFILTRTGDLTFELPGVGGGRTQDVKFTKNEAGQVTEASVNGKHPWIKVKEYKPAVTVKLTPEQLKAVAGKYQLERNKHAFLTINAAGQSLTLKQLWDGKEITNFQPLTDHEFLNVKEAFDLKFVLDSSGKATKMIAFQTDVWDRVGD